jgi:menaquinol-cytochrome c reductase iron-sulfur subunit
MAQQERASKKGAAPDPQGSSSDKPSGRQGQGKEDRRGFIASAAAWVLGLGACVPPVVCGLRTFIAPMSRKRQTGKFYRLATLDLLEEKPQKFSIIDDYRDAWMVEPDQKIGAVFLRKTAEGKVEALQSICPHNGCTIQVGQGTNPVTGEETSLLLCPCHEAYFDFQGERLVAEGESSPSPRPMDTLEVEIRNDNEVWVKFQQFKTATDQKIPLG